MPPDHRGLVPRGHLGTLRGHKGIGKALTVWVSNNTVYERESCVAAIPIA